MKTHRTELKQKRDALSGDERQAASHAVVIQLQSITQYQHAHHIAVYYPIHHELSCLGLLNASPNKHFYVPKIRVEQHDLVFLPYVEDMPKNQYGIPEPVGTLAHHPEVIIMPLLGFDGHGNRIGYGKGHYDRTLGKYPKTVRPYCIGIGYDVQEVPLFTPDLWDIPCDMIVTPTRILTCTTGF